MATPNPGGEPSRPSNDASTHSTESFQTYDQYIRFLESASEFPSGLTMFEEHDGKDDIWLLQFQDAGQLSKVYRHRTGAVRPDPYAPQREYEYIDTAHDFRRQLRKFDTVVKYQVIILCLYYDAPFSETIDVLGLGLDMEYGVLNHLLRPHSWTGSTHVVDIGDNTFIILGAIHNARPRTAIIVLRPLRSLSSRTHVRHIMNPFPPPSLVKQSMPLKRIPRAWREHFETWICRQNIMSAGNCPLSSLHMLLSLHLGKPPQNIPIFGRTPDAEKLTLKYVTNLNDEEVKVDARTLWLRLRDEATTERLNLTALAPFIVQHFSLANEDPKAREESLQGRYERYVKEIEMAEAQLRDFIGIQASQKGVEMAEKSIAESKRVMLLTAIAFVILPTSLASSIYGMNVQQINDTGHSITAFVITAIALTVASLAFWGASAGYVALKNRSISKWTRSPPTKFFGDEPIMDVFFNLGFTAANLVVKWKLQSMFHNISRKFKKEQNIGDSA